jgi:hypothetical protein
MYPPADRQNHGRGPGTLAPVPPTGAGVHRRLRRSISAWSFGPRWSRRLFGWRHDQIVTPVVGVARRHGRFDRCCEWRSCGDRARGLLRGAVRVHTALVVGRSARVAERRRGGDERSRECDPDERVPGVGLQGMSPWIVMTTGILLPYSRRPRTRYAGFRGRRGRSARLPTRSYGQWVDNRMGSRSCSPVRPESAFRRMVVSGGATGATARSADSRCHIPGITPKVADFVHSGGLPGRGATKQRPKRSQTAQGDRLTSKGDSVSLRQGLGSDGYDLSQAHP